MSIKINAFYNLYLLINFAFIIYYSWSRFHIETDGFTYSKYFRSLKNDYFNNHRNHKE